MATKHNKSEKMCFYERLKPLGDLDSMHSALPRTYGFNKLSKEMNDTYANTDFDDRNFALKMNRLKIIATEECLDDWYAQSVGVPLDKFIKQKRMYQQIMNDAKRKNERKMRQISQGQ
mmetsp:Transcript_14407/g.24554  ORF Transcript_14407/g.24554 Transcript_14407/m.24554 type:complete len:118 (+) Transcript_14407:470-823(+)